MERVEILAKAGVTEVPSKYIQPPEARPNLHGVGDASEVPIISLSSSYSAREAIGRACRDWGAFHVVDHGIPIELLDRMRAAGLSFFKDCSTEEKLKYACDPKSVKSEGYGSRLLVSDKDDTVLDWRDYFEHNTFPLSRRDPSRWPASPPDYRKAMGEYADEMKKLAQKLLGLISQSLDLPSSALEDAVGEIYQNITLCYYPPCPQPDLTIGLRSHSDLGAITLLIQDDVEGLQIFKDDQWFTVPPLSNAIVVLLSDQTEIITNGIYKSGQHRAITNASRARLSIATFHDPPKTAKIKPASLLISQASPARYREVVYGEYASSWYSQGPQGTRNPDNYLL